MAYNAYITKIYNVRKHPNADRLILADVFDTTVIVDNSYTENQKVVYFPCDGQLSEKFCKDNHLLRNDGGYLDANKRNIKAIKLRGEKSDGLVLPITVLSSYCNIDTLDFGFSFSCLNGEEICKKYIPKVNRSYHHGSTKKAHNTKEEKEQIGYPYFEPHIDTEQLMYHKDDFHEGDHIVLTRKLHGTSFRVGNTLQVTTKVRNKFLKKLGFKDKVTKKYAVVGGTRRVVLRDYSGGYYGDNTFRKKYTDLFEDKLIPGMTVYGEIVGYINESTLIMPSASNKKIQDKAFSLQYGDRTEFTYGCEPGESKCFVYRVTITTEDGTIFDLSTNEIRHWCTLWNVEYVPYLEEFFYTTWEDLNHRIEKYLDIPEPLANSKHIAEGVVVRNESKYGFKAYKSKGYYFKILSGIIAEDIADGSVQVNEELIEEV